MMFNDDQLQRAVAAELLWEPSIMSDHIAVTVESGVVTLSGFVESLAEKKSAETAACRIKGIKALVHQILVRPPPGAIRKDDDIAVAALNCLASDVSVRKGTTLVSVEDGWITLTGQVESHFQREAAEQDVCRLAGVLGVSNQIAIRPRSGGKDINDQISRALCRSWFFDPRAIRVTTSDGKVTLSGNVRTLHEREAAENVAWSAPGITCVENALEIV